MTGGREQLAAILDAVGDCVYALDRDWRITIFNRGAVAFFGKAREQMIGRVVWDALQVRNVPVLEPAYRAAMNGIASGLIEVESPARPGRWIEGRAFPIPGGIGVSFRDVTERREAESSLRQREAELARVQRIAKVGGLEVDLRRGFSNRRSPEYLHLHGLPAEAATESHADWVRRIHPADRDRVDRHFRDTIVGRASQYAAEYRIVRPSDGEERWIAATAEIERDAAGRAVRLVGAHRDITDRKRAEIRRDLLINELNHRVKNTLATVQSIAAQTWRQAADREQSWGAFERRLIALSRTHDVLTRESWESAEVGELVAQAIEPYGRADEKFALSGESARVGPQTALALAMALQELLTNAAKYGALSTEAGRVEIVWSTTFAGDGGQRLRLRWEERGGPPVIAPTRRGFGSRLIERSLSQDLGGTVRLAFEPDGVICAIEASLAASTNSALQAAIGDGSTPDL